jgi:hypothetical protein
MRIRFSIRLVRGWPLVFAGLAVLGLVRAVPDLYQDFRFWRSGAHAIGWCLSFDQDNYIDGHPYFSYSYKVGTITYGGHGLYYDQNSDIAFRNVATRLGSSTFAKHPGFRRSEL